MDKTPWQSLDFLSPPVTAVLEADAQAAYRHLVVQGTTPPGAREMLGGLYPDDLIKLPVRDVAYARAMLAGLWLWHDGLNESHEISQALPSATGSFWHAIMHCREGDFSNAKYWYARCRSHPVIGQLAYDPDDFVDDVARASPLGKG